MPGAAASGQMSASPTTEAEVSPMAHHLTPDELARATGLERRDVIANCLETGVPIFRGKIDRTLFDATMRERVAVEAGSSARA